MALAQADTTGQRAIAFQFPNRGRIRRILVHVQHACQRIVLGAEYLAKEAFRGVRIPSCREQKVNGLARGIHCAVEIPVLTPDLYIGFVNPVAFVGRL